MTLVKYRIPPREVFDRYAPPVRYNLIKGYHRKLTEKHRWYVRSLDGYFYCDGERPNISAVEIFDCDWSPDEWDKRPYRHFYNPIQKAWYESYAHEGYPLLRELYKKKYRDFYNNMAEEIIKRFNIPTNQI